MSFVLLLSMPCGFLRDHCTKIKEGAEKKISQFWCSETFLFVPALKGTPKELIARASPITTSRPLGQMFMLHQNSGHQYLHYVNSGRSAAAIFIQCVCFMQTFALFIYLFRGEDICELLKARRRGSFRNLKLVIRIFLINPSMGYENRLYQKQNICILLIQKCIFDQIDILLLVSIINVFIWMHLSSAFNVNYHQNRQSLNFTLEAFVVL